MPRTTARNPSEQKLLDDVRAFGWHCMSVLGNETREPFSYTIGLFQTFGHPELLIYGLPRDIAHSVLGIAAAAAARGQAIDLSRPTQELIEGCLCSFVPVPLAAYAAHLAAARWYHEGDAFPVQQVVWPSNTGQFPWHPEASSDFRSMQPVLGQPANGA